MDHRRPQNNRIEHKTINRKSILLILSPFKRVTELDVAQAAQYSTSLFLSVSRSYMLGVNYLRHNRLLLNSKGIFPVES